jgi:hypothetical protein
MEMHKESPCISYLYLKLAKHHVFLIVFYVFSSTKLENRRVRGCGLAGGEVAGKEVGG